LTATTTSLRYAGARRGRRPLDHEALLALTQREAELAGVLGSLRSGLALATCSG
jgi:hypothetical protein